MHSAVGEAHALAWGRSGALGHYRRGHEGSLTQLQRGLLQQRELAGERQRVGLRCKHTQASKRASSGPGSAAEPTAELLVAHSELAETEAWEQLHAGAAQCLFPSLTK